MYVGVVDQDGLIKMGEIKLRKIVTTCFFIIISVPAHEGWLKRRDQESWMPRKASEAGFVSFRYDVIN